MHKLFTESQHQRLTEALEILESLNDEITDEYPIPQAIEQVLFFTSWALKESYEMPVISDRLHS